MNEKLNQLSEDQVVQILIKYLENDDWIILDFCLGHKRGYDIVASKENRKLYIEAKGAKANIDSPIKKRDHFDSGQIKDHLGKAIVKSIETKIRFPNEIVAIAQPNDEYLKSVSKDVTDYLLNLQIFSFWVNSSGEVSTNLKF